MQSPKICLSLTCKTLREDVELIKKYRDYIDIAELRVDHLSEEEQLSVRNFPSMIDVPCILTIRRVQEGGVFSGNEFSRTTLFARALAFADTDPSKNFAYVDFETDFNVPSLLDAASAFGVKIIRSYHKFDGPVENLAEEIIKMRQSPNEIPKIAFMPKKLSDVTNLYREVKKIHGQQYIVCAMGNMGFSTRVLAYKTGSFLTYTSPESTLKNVPGIGHTDPKTLIDLYNFRNLNSETKIFAVTGYPLKVTSSPKIHNAGYKNHKLNAVFIPLPSTSIEESFDFANEVGLSGMAVTVPYKEKMLDILDEVDMQVGEIGACNTVFKVDGRWIGRNTDCFGVMCALREFLGEHKLKRKKVAIIGAGGAAKAVCYAVKQMGGRACIFNRTLDHAKMLAERFGFEYASLTESSAAILDRYSDLIIQTTNVGMHSTEPSNKENNPIWFYKFRGTEKLMDIIYDPEETPVMKKAKDAGCSVCNGFPMLRYQGEKQFKFFTGIDY